MTAAATAQQSQQQEEELMLRLQAQFGDMDLTNLLQGQPAADDAESEESSLAEPSPEELRAWQEAQFKKGQAQLDAKKEATKSAVQKRRDQVLKEEDKDWEQLPSAPKFLQGQSSMFFPATTHKGDAEIVGIHPLLQQLGAEGDEILGTTWQRLFSSAEHGLNLPNLLQKLEGYPGPTILLIGAVPSPSKSLTKMTMNNSSPTTIGFFTTSSWGVGDSPDCFLFAFDDDSQGIQFFRPTRPDDKTRSYMHCQSSANKTQTQQQGGNTNNNIAEGGIWIGGESTSKPRLHLTETLEECRALEFCNVFEAGDLLLGQAKDSLNYFDVSHVEVWAVGGEEWIQESLATQKHHQAIGEANRLKRATVDKKQFLDDFRGGLLSTNMKPEGLFAHYGYNTERCDM